MPLLILKLYALINNPEHDLILGSVDMSALCACLMILLGAYSRLGLDELANIDEQIEARRQPERGDVASQPELVR